MNRFTFIALAVCITSAAGIDVFSTLIEAEYPSLNTFPVTCDITVKEGMCLYGGQKVLLTSPQPSGLAGHWTFDDKLGADSSGYGNNAATTINSGPTFGPSGYSAAMNGTNYVEITNATALNSEGLRYCPLLLRGEDESSSTDRGLAIYFDRLNYGLRIYISSNITGEYFDSSAAIPFSKWTHITVVRKEKRTKLYVNGILDSSLSSQGIALNSDAPLYLGNTPWRIDECPVLAYFDELKIYWGPLSATAIQSEATVMASNGNPNSINLGCINCTKLEAKLACYTGYHVCTTVEIDSFAFQAAYTLGYVQWGTVIWSYEATAGIPTTVTDEESSEIDTTIGLGLCCQN